MRPSVSKCWQKYQFLTIRTVEYRRLLRRHDVEGESGFCPVKWWSSLYQDYKRLPCFKGDRRGRGFGAKGHKSLLLMRHWHMRSLGSPLSYISSSSSAHFFMGRKAGVKCQRACQEGGVRGFNQAGTMWSVGLESLLQHSFRIKMMSVFLCWNTFSFPSFNVQK